MTGGAFTPRSEEFLRSSPVPQVAKPISLEMLQGAIRQVGRGHVTQLASRGSAELAIAGRTLEHAAPRQRPASPT